MKFHSLAFAIVLSAMQCLAADFSGTWLANSRTVSIAKFDLSSSGSELKGTEAARSGVVKFAIQDGKVNGDEISFRIDKSLGENKIIMIYKGKIVGDTIEFTMQ